MEEDVLINKKYHIPYASRFENALSAALACINIALVAVISEFTEFSAVVTALIFTLVYLVEIAVIGKKRGQRIFKRFF